MLHANLLQQQFLPKNGPHCVCALIFRWSLLHQGSRGRLQTEKCMRHMHKVWTVNCINGHSFCSAEWVYSSYARIRIRIRIRSSHSGMSNGATFNWMNKRHLIELRLCSQCISLAPTAFLHMYSYEYVCMYMSVLGESDICMYMRSAGAYFACCAG